MHKPELKKMFYLFECRESGHYDTKSLFPKYFSSRYIHRLAKHRKQIVMNA